MAKTKRIHELWVQAEKMPYPILIGKDLLQDKCLLKTFINKEKILIITNTTIAPLYLESLLSTLSDCQCQTVILKDGEVFKNAESLFQIFTHLIEKEYHRDSLIIALGGGVIGDISGFAASTYQRGIDFVQIPTTLLAQVDASVGGKTAINFHQAKNCIGSFYQPKAVIMDMQLLQTLPLREFRAGLAEVIKYAFLEGNTFFTIIQQALEQGLATNTAPNLAEIIYKCCQLKARIVEKDEKEQGVRALLNLGHTVGHALESYTEYQRWLHGEAVAIGLYVAALLSQAQCALDEKWVKALDRMLELACLPRRIAKDIDLKALRLHMNQDKKILNNKLSFVLVKKPGQCYLEKNINEHMLMDVLKKAMENEV